MSIKKISPGGLDEDSAPAGGLICPGAWPFHTRAGGRSLIPECSVSVGRAGASAPGSIAITANDSISIMGRSCPSGSHAGGSLGAARRLRCGAVRDVLRAEPRRLLTRRHGERSPRRSLLEKPRLGDGRRTGAAAGLAGVHRGPGRCGRHLHAHAGAAGRRGEHAGSLLQ